MPAILFVIAESDVVSIFNTDPSIKPMLVSADSFCATELSTVLITTFCACPSSVLFCIVPYVFIPEVPVVLAFKSVTFKPTRDTAFSFFVIVAFLFISTFKFVLSAFILPASILALPPETASTTVPSPPMRETSPLTIEAEVVFVLEASILTLSAVNVEPFVLIFVSPPVEVETTSAFIEIPPPEKSSDSILAVLSSFEFIVISLSAVTVPPVTLALALPLALASITVTAASTNPPVAFLVLTVDLIKPALSESTAVPALIFTSLAVIFPPSIPEVNEAFESAS